MGPQGRRPLESVRVVDLGVGIAVAHASRLLADAGAQIVSIEPRAGDPLRRRGVSSDSFDAAGDGVLFRYLRTGQRALALDLEHGAARAALRRLYRTCDAVLATQPLAWLDERDLGPRALARIQPAASWLSLSSFGSEGLWSDRPANEFTLQAWCGSTASRGRPGLEPLTAGGEVGEWISGTYAALGVAAALRAARRDGRGARVDLSKLEAITPTLTNAGSVWAHFSQVHALPPSEDVPSIEPTADGWIGFCLFTAQQWKDFAVLVERPEWGEDASLAHMGVRLARVDEIRGGVREYTRRHTTAELLERSEWLRVPAAPIGHGALLPELDHLIERGVFVRNPRGGFRQPRVPCASDAWDRPPLRPAATLAAALAEGDALTNHEGAKDDVELARGGEIDRPIEAPGSGSGPSSVAAAARDEDAASAARARPLDGIRVLDLTAFWAGPYGTYVLGCLGADVIHVESIQRPDGMRFGTQKSHDSEAWWEFGPTYHSANAGKRSLTLDLTRPRGIELLLELVAQSDVLIENFSPRVFDNFGLDREKLLKANPRLVFVRMPAFGLDGPWRNRVGFAQTMEQVSGLAWLTAYPASAGEQVGPLTPRACADPLAGLNAAFSALLGLAQRDVTGQGCAIESPMVETLLAITAEGIAEWDASGTLLAGDGNRSRFAAPQGLYVCAGRDELGQPERAAISIGTELQWRALAALIGRSDWAGDPAFASLAGRLDAHDAIDASVAEWCRTQPLARVVERLLVAGIPAAPVTASRRGVELPPIAESDFIQIVSHPLAGPVPIPTQPLRFEGMGGRGLERAAPLLGEHNEEILRDRLGLSPQAIDGLRRDGIIGERPSGL